MDWHAACVGDRRGAHIVLLGGFGGKGSLGSPRSRWEDIVTMILQEVWWDRGLY